MKNIIHIQTILVLFNKLKSEYNSWTHSKRIKQPDFNFSTFFIITSPLLDLMLDLKPIAWDLRHTAWTIYARLNLHLDPHPVSNCKLYVKYTTKGNRWHKHNFMHRFQSARTIFPSSLNRPVLLNTLFYTFEWSQKWIN